MTIPPLPYDRRPNRGRGHGRLDGLGGRRTPKPRPEAPHQLRGWRRRYIQWERGSHEGASRITPLGGEWKLLPLKDEREKLLPPRDEGEKEL